MKSVNYATLFLKYSRREYLYNFPQYINIPDGDVSSVSYRGQQSTDLLFYSLTGSTTLTCFSLMEKEVGGLNLWMHLLVCLCRYIKPNSTEALHECGFQCRTFSSALLQGIFGFNFVAILFFFVSDPFNVSVRRRNIDLKTSSLEFPRCNRD